MFFIARIGDRPSLSAYGAGEYAPDPDDIRVKQDEIWIQQKEILLRLNKILEKL